METLLGSCACLCVEFGLRLNNASEFICLKPEIIWDSYSLTKIQCYRDFSTLHGILLDCSTGNT
uniref:Uncharacterized protein n=1 Tax=Macaca nemestrina TaxID=9545 RepID=A0A2K6B690_MACNE